MNTLSKYISLMILAFATLPGFSKNIHVITIGDAITPVTARYIIDHVELAEKKEAECLIIRLDTPGGLLDATLDIDKTLLAANVPVVVYISPRGGRAASAGVFITYAAHLAAMAPSTNIGSAHPVSLVGKDSSKVMMEKVTNDAISHIRGLADQRGRNADWAESAIHENFNITEKEALKLNIINFIADDVYDLIEQMDGVSIKLSDGERNLNTKDSSVIEKEMSWRYKILDKISNPNIAYLLMVLGGLGLFFELQNPGTILPGVIGAICIILFLFTTQVFSINIAGLLLIILAIVFFVLEVNIPSYGLLTIGGIVSMLLGSLMIFKTPSVQVSLSVILPAVLATAGFFAFAIGLGIKAQKQKAATGQKGMIGETGEVIKTINLEGQIAVHGEIWKAIADEKINKGTAVKVIGINGLTVKVEKV